MKTEIFSAADPIALSDAELNEVLTASRDGDFADRRSVVRNTCFAPVSLTPCGDPRQRLSAFSRDLSTDGLGLLHNMPIERGSIYALTLRHPQGELCRSAQVMWCRPCGEGWYLSGWRFVKATN